MKEAYGGIFNMVFIVIFLVIAIGVLGLTFSYTKAFKMKSAVIAAIEEYEGNINHAGCQKRITEAANNLGYSPISGGCSSDFSLSGDGYYCYKVVAASDGMIIYRVIVEADISFPLMKQIVGFSLFKVSGDTKEIRVRYQS